MSHPLKTLDVYAANAQRLRRLLARVAKNSVHMDCFTSYDEVIDLCTDTSLKSCQSHLAAGVIFIVPNLGGYLLIMFLISKAPAWLIWLISGKFLPTPA